MNLELNGKTAFVAGSSDGIGKACAKGLAAEGCSVMLCGRSVQKLTELQEHLRSSSTGRIEHVHGDLDRGEDIQRLINRTLEVFGHVDILITNNGGPPPKPAEALDEDDCDLGFRRTLLSALRLVRGFLPGMKSNRWGRIVNLTSISVRQPIMNLALSNTFRPALTGFAKTLADEVGPLGITVNNLAPGFIETSRTEALFRNRADLSGRSIKQEHDSMIESIPMRRLGTPADVASLVIFLCSEQAAYITGTTMLVDGGLNRGIF